MWCSVVSLLPTPYKSRGGNRMQIVLLKTESGFVIEFEAVSQEHREVLTAMSDTGIPGSALVRIEETCKLRIPVKDPEREPPKDAVQEKAVEHRGNPSWEGSREQKQQIAWTRYLRRGGLSSCLDDR